MVSENDVEAEISLERQQHKHLFLGMIVVFPFYQTGLYSFSTLTA